MSKFEPGRTLFEIDRQAFPQKILAQMWAKLSPKRRQFLTTNEEIIILTFLREAQRKAEKLAKDVGVSPYEPYDYCRAICETIEEYEN